MEPIVTDYSIVRRILGELASCGVDIVDVFKASGHARLTDVPPEEYQSVYIDLYQKYRPKIDGDKENINDDIEFEIELIRQVEINIDYILMLVGKYHASNCKDTRRLLGVRLVR